MQHYYDVIVLGESLASRIAAVLLARGGCRVLTFRDPGTPLRDWLWPSLHLERLLERLDGRACFIPPTPFQVLTRENRLEFNGPNTLEEELRREFGNSFSQVAAPLHQLQLLGQRLEEALWQCSASPLMGIAGRLRFAGKRLRHRLPAALLRRPFRAGVNAHGPDSVRGFLDALFSGLALRPANRLSMAEAALLWNGAGKATGISYSALEELLNRRYSQFFGEEEELDALQGLTSRKSTLTGVSLKDGAQRGARYFLLGSSAGFDLLPEGLRRPPLSLPPPPPVQFVTSPLGDKVSPLLAPRVILNGERPFRIRFTPNNHDVVAVIDCIPGEAPAADLEERLERGLREILPFADFRLEQFSPEAVTVEPPSSTGRSFGRPFPGVQASLKSQGNWFCCQGARVFPSLGATGEVLTGMAVGRHLLRELKKPVEI